MLKLKGDLMKNKNVFGLLIVMSLIVASISASALSPFNNGWQTQIGKQSSLHSLDKYCDKGMISGRVYDLMSKGYVVKCVWLGSDNKKIKSSVGGGLNVEDNTPEENDEGEEASDEDGDEGTGGGSGEEDDEGGCENNDNDCKEEEVCEVVEYKVKERVCEWKGFGRHKFLDCDWEWVIKEKNVCHSEIVCEEDKD